MSATAKPLDNSPMSQVLQPLLWFLLMASTLACASHFALDMVR